jgi:uncharacterized coiled-coil protein SlyX
MSEELERRVAALEARSREQDKLIAWLCARSLPHSHSLGISEAYRLILQKLKEKLRQITSGEKLVRSWNIEYGETLSPELEE